MLKVGSKRMRFVYGSRVHTLYFQSSTGCPVAFPQRDGAVEDVCMTEQVNLVR
jgi:hypothetical protein